MAELLHEFHRHQADISYHPIVGGGANGCILHYHENADTLRDGDLLLIDAGCEYGLYASDITRTFPVNGRFSPEQKAIYDIVLEAQEAAFACIRPGNHWNEPHDAAVRAITQGLVRLGLLKGRVPTLIKEEAYRKFYMHRTGHWLGMDVHDVGEYKVGSEWRVFEPGMALTVEPGIYIPARHERRAQALVEHRRAHRGRRPGHRRRLRTAHGRAAPHDGRSRAGDGRRLSRPPTSA